MEVVLEKTWIWTTKRSDGLTSSITGSAVKRAGGGNGGDNLSGNNNFGGGNGNADGGDTNKGGGAGGGKSGVNGGVGGSGIVILRFPNTVSISIGSGLSSSTASDGSDTVVSFTSGSGTVSFS